MYEYEVVKVIDDKSGNPNENKISYAINERARKGWRLVAVTTNEIGKTASSVSIVGLGAEVNATIEETLLFLKRGIFAH